MSAPISQMDEDLARFAAGFAKQAVENVRKVADDMASAVDSMSTPAYGVAIRTRTTEVPMGAKVDVSITPVPAAIGKVYGGFQAAAPAVEKKMDSIAKGAGLD